MLKESVKLVISQQIEIIKQSIVLIKIRPITLMDYVDIVTFHIIIIHQELKNEIII